MNREKLAQFEGEQYISLETFRKNGQGVRTPVWFAESDGLFYIYSLADAGKVKRIRNNPQVRIAPCTMRGSVTGQWTDARARILESAEARRADELITEKYGWKKKFGDLFRKLRKKSRAYISIKVE